MTKRAKVYQILTFAFGISLIILLLFMGITAVQKSMKLNIGFEVKPTFLCEIELNGEQIFSNHDENATIANGADLTGNTLTLNQTFYADLGAELTFTLYNYSEFKTKVSVKNTDKFAILPAYANGTASSGTITLDTPSGNVELVFEEYVMYTLTFNANTGSGSMSSMETGSGEILVLPTNTFTKDGYAFVGWNTKSDGSGTTYTNLANISLTENTTLYAVWEWIPYTLNLNFDSFTDELGASSHDWSKVSPIWVVVTNDNGFDSFNKRENGSSRNHKIWTSTNRTSIADEYYSYETCTALLYEMNTIPNQCTITQAIEKGYLDSSKYDYREYTFTPNSTGTITINNLTENHKIFLLGTYVGGWERLTIQSVSPNIYNDTIGTDLNVSFLLPTNIANAQNVIDLSITIKRCYD